MPEEPSPIEIERLLPHRGEALFVRGVLAQDSRSIQCACTVPASSAYVQKEGVPALVTIELAAQAAALHGAMHPAQHAALAAASTTLAPSSGYLVGVKELQIHTDSFPADAEVIVTAQRVAEQSQMSTWSFEARTAAELLAHGTLSVWQR